MAFDGVWLNGPVATMRSGGAAYGAIPDGVVAVTDDRLAWVGPRAEFPDDGIGPQSNVHDVAGAWMTPGLVGLPHAPRVWRRQGGRVRGAAPGGVVR